MKAAKPPAKAPSRRKKPRLPPALDNRVIIENVRPQIDAGVHPVKRVVGEIVEVSADIYSDGHDVLASRLLINSPEGSLRTAELRHSVNDRWLGQFEVDLVGRWTFQVTAWRDPYLSWAADTQKKLNAGLDVSLELREGLEILDQVDAESSPDGALQSWQDKLRAANLDVSEAIELLLSDAVRALMKEHGPKHWVCHSTPVLSIWVDRRTAAFSSWYELFPRSQGADAQTHGTFKDVIQRLPYVRDLGFDVLYFPPIHPIGLTNRKGRNNSLKAAAGDPGSVYAIGSEAGGHDAVHPELGTLADFDDLVKKANAHGLEIALDFAVQCSPDHPWIKEHREWFDWRPDGTIKFAENPPKKYEDIVNLKIEIPEVRQALLDIIFLWVERGVKIFRVDNPHTKPVPFWTWLISSVNQTHPDVIFLAEAFTRPKMMKQLAKIGFQQSYTYFTWRNTKPEIIEYVTELCGEMSEYYRPNFFVNTPDINPLSLQGAPRAAFVIRATLAATLSGNWGLYSGFEICESEPIPGKEEYVDSEKYQLKQRDFSSAGNITNEIRALNRIRKEHRALQDVRGTMFLNCWNDQVLAYARFDRSSKECILVIVNLDPIHSQSCDYEIPLWEYGLPDWGSLEATDLLHGNSFTLNGKVHSITIDPSIEPAVIWRLKPPGGANA